MIAKAVDAPLPTTGTASSALALRLLPRIPAHRYHWAYRPGAAGRRADQRRIGLRLGGHGGSGVRPVATRKPRTAHSALLAEARPEVARSIGGTAPVGALRAFPAGPAGSAPVAGRGGRWWATPALSRIRSPPTASRMPCATRSCWRARSSIRPAACAPGQAPCTNTSAPDRLSEPLSTSPAHRRFPLGSRRTAHRSPRAEPGHATRIDALLELDETTA